MKHSIYDQINSIEYNSNDSKQTRNGPGKKASAKRQKQNTIVCRRVSIEMVDGERWERLGAKVPTEV